MTQPTIYSPTHEFDHEICWFHLRVFVCLYEYNRCWWRIHIGLFDRITAAIGKFGVCSTRYWFVIFFGVLLSLCHNYAHQKQSTQLISEMHFTTCVSLPKLKTWLFFNCNSKNISMMHSFLNWLTYFVCTARW